MAKDKGARDNVGRTPSERRENTENATTEKPDPNVTEEGEVLTEEIDRLLDELDEILEEGSEEFVTNYVQRGGE